MRTEEDKNMFLIVHLTFLLSMVHTSKIKCLSEDLSKVLFHVIYINEEKKKIQRNLPCDPVFSVNPLN